jgi:hypothetical protein
VYAETKHNKETAAVKNCQRVTANFDRVHQTRTDEKEEAVHRDNPIIDVYRHSPALRIRR